MYIHTDMSTLQTILHDIGHNRNVVTYHNKQYEKYIILDKSSPEYTNMSHLSHDDLHELFPFDMHELCPFDVKELYVHFNRKRLT